MKLQDYNTNVNFQSSKEGYFCTFALLFKLLYWAAAWEHW